MPPENSPDRLFELIYLEAFKETNASGKNALQAAILLNGGAAVALLAFVGNILAKETKVTNATSLKPTLAAAMGCFGLGVLASAIAAAFVYLTQLAHTRYVEAGWQGFGARQAGDDREGANLQQQANEHRRKGRRLNNLAIGCGVGSLVLFVAGLLFALRAFWIMR